ncbi:MAG: right-handed parallel beta-helix repeat-containing protein [Chitinispirillales bacterium]|jgi:hypothetical protein|nr:right-handed parallel beta-helix repeat-containing protein [Chitinispirillales bacterium]
MKILAVLFLLATTAFPEIVRISPSNSSPISQAMLRVKSGDTIMLADGKYREDVILKSGVVLCSQNLFAAEIIGNGRDAVVKLNGGAKIIGLSICGGRNGVVTSNTGASIENCYIHSNQGSGILAINRLPKIVNSIISNNLNAGIQGTAIGSTEGEMSHLTIAENRRYGIEIDGDQDVILKDCLFYNNGHKAIKLTNQNLLVMKNLIIYPEQKEFINQDDFIGRPYFTGKHYFLKDNSIGKNKASDGKDIGFVK